jgi:hypothetical protein
VQRDTSARADLLRPGHPEDPDNAKRWIEPAAADFKKAVERDIRHYLAWDRLGLIHLSTCELDMAISDFTQEMASIRLAARGWRTPTVSAGP